MVINGKTPLSIYDSEATNQIDAIFVNCSDEDLIGFFSVSEITINGHTRKIKHLHSIMHQDDVGQSNVDVTWDYVSSESEEIEELEEEIAEKDAKLNSIKEALDALGDSVTIAKLKAFVEAVKAAVSDLEIQNDE